MWGMSATLARAQENYEIQVYPYDQVEPRHTMVELHSNFTIDRQQGRCRMACCRPTNAEHETIEITHGFTDWFETGFYIFTYQRDGFGVQWVGDHIRPRVRIPSKWKWPVGLSLSNEIGYQRRKFSVDTWTWEMRPVIDKQMGPWYLSFNPTFDKSFHGGERARWICFFAEPENQLRLHQEDYRRDRVLRIDGTGHAISAVERTAAPDFPRHRPEFVAEVGSEFWVGRGCYAFDRSPDRENDSRVSFRFLNFD